jgi:hypothetical protein
MPLLTPFPDPREEILATHSLLFRPGQVVELRVPKYPRGNATTAGYFNDPSALAEYALRASGLAPGVYVTLNELNPALLARFNNRVETWVSQTTTDADVIRRRWLPLDFDPVRPAGISSTASEHEAARKRALECRRWLKEQGWPEPIMADSGNGFHMLFSIDLPNDDDARGLVNGCLKAVSAKFSDSVVTVDVGVGNAARIWKLYGTLAAKGDATDERPHRQARLLTRPGPIDSVTVAQLEALAASAPTAEPPPPSANGQAGGARLDVSNWLTARGIPYRVKPAKPTDNRTKYQIICPFDPSHADAAVMQDPAGKLSAHCFHASCADKGWAAFKAAIGPPDPEHYNPPLKGKAGPGEAKSHRPIPSHRPFPVEALPKAVRQYVEGSAAAIGCDPALVALPVLAVLGAAVGNSRRIQLKKGWTEPAVVWATVLAPSGELKSPAFDAALAHVRRLQDAAVAEWRQAWRAYKDAGAEGQPPICRRYLTTDTTVEALAVVLEQNPHGLLMTRDELNGWLASMDTYKGGKGGDVAHYLEMHRAGQLLVDRKTGPKPMVHVPRAALSVVGTTQPETFRRALGREHFEDGLLPRFLLAMPPRKAREWTEQVVDVDVAKGFAAVIDRLYSLDMRPTGVGDEPWVLPLSAEAKEVWIAFYNQHGREQIDLDGDLAAAWSKLEGYCARLALLIELAGWAGSARPPQGKACTLGESLAAALGPQSVSAQSVEAAVKLVEWFGYEAQRVYALLGDSEEDRELHRLTDWIRARGGSVTARELQQSGQRAYRGRVEDAEAALDRLVAAGVGEWVVMKPGARGGRPTRKLLLVAATEPAEKTAN